MTMFRPRLSAAVRAAAIASCRLRSELEFVAVEISELTVGFSTSAIVPRRMDMYRLSLALTRKPDLGYHWQAAAINVQSRRGSERRPASGTRPIGQFSGGLSEPKGHST